MLLELAGFSWNQLGIGYPRTMPSEGPQGSSGDRPPLHLTNKPTGAFNPTGWDLSRRKTQNTSENPRTHRIRTHGVYLQRALLSFTRPPKRGVKLQREGEK